ncbi:hypothetical protein [Marinicrinis lubricantis]|uniref:DUF2798 domain-containing protein n=1 Tax=Marinicrinis lubricantis TaxID=2086470 RepID=A0ABW1IUW8_9BACL
MPTTKKEQLYFGFMMCFRMVTVMTVYNLIINGLMGEVSFTKVLFQFVIGFMIAYVLELFIVGPAARKIAFSMPFAKSSKIGMVLSMSICMVVGMVVMMSFFGLGTSYFAGNLDSNQLAVTYLHNVMMNFIAALPLQLLIMGPIVRYVFNRFVKELGFVKTV